MPESNVRANGERNVLLATELQARGQRDGVFDCLSGTIPGRWKIGVRSVTDLDNSSIGRSPILLRIAPPQPKVDNRVWRRSLDQLLEDFGPWRPGHLLDALNNFVGFNGIAPALLFRASDLVPVSIVHEVRASH